MQEKAKRKRNENNTMNLKTSQHKLKIFRLENTISTEKMRLCRFKYLLMNISVWHLNLILNPMGMVSPEAVELQNESGMKERGHTG